QFALFAILHTLTLLLLLTSYTSATSLKNGYSITGPEKVCEGVYTRFTFSISTTYSNSFCLWETPEGWLVNGEYSGPGMQVKAGKEVVVLPSQSTGEIKVTWMINNEIAGIYTKKISTTRIADLALSAPETVCENQEFIVKSTHPCIWIVPI